MKTCEATLSLYDDNRATRTVSKCALPKNHTNSHVGLQQTDGYKMMRVSWYDLCNHRYGNAICKMRKDHSGDHVACWTDETK